MHWLVIVMVIISLLVSLAWVASPVSEESTTNEVPVLEDNEGVIPERITESSTRHEVTDGDSETHLDLSAQGLTSVPRSVFDERDLTQLDLSDNLLTGALQAEIRQLSRLTVLDLSDNQFTGVPAEIGQLSDLEYLDLSNNRLTGLPHELGNLKKLKTLDLRGNDPAEFDLTIIKASLPDTSILTD